LGEYKDLPQYAGDLRRRKAVLDSSLLFHNISYLNNFIEKQFLEEFKKSGNEVYIK